jgi:hypothetical protein
MNDWLIYRGSGEQHDGIARLPAPPNWRTFDDLTGPPEADHQDTGWAPGDLLRGSTYRPETPLLDPVNAALYLRRPLMVTGRPGVGKSTLAYSVAYELGLGPVLRWSITSRSSLKDSLYRYDAISRLHDANLKSPDVDTGIGRYLRLGPLGTALLPRNTPRVVLIDEIDKADIDLPNDMLTVFEEGEYEIAELNRMADKVPVAHITTADGTEQVPITEGKVRCRQFPLIIMTSNGEREFPAAFLRRCLRLDIEAPGLDQLTAIVEARLGAEMSATAGSLIGLFHQRAQESDLATDQLLNAIHLTCQVARDSPEWTSLVELLLRPLTSNAV